MIGFCCLTVLACLGRNFDHGIGHSAVTIPGTTSDTNSSRTSYCCDCKLGQDIGPSWMQTWTRPQRVMIFTCFLIWKMKTFLSAQIWISKKSHVYFTKFQRHPTYDSDLSSISLISAFLPTSLDHRTYHSSMTDSCRSCLDKTLVLGVINKQCTL